MENKDKIILDLCGGTGAWSKPYKDAGYDVRNITLPDYDVRLYKPPENVYGILAAPPCEQFSFVRTTPKIPRNLEKGMECITTCLRIIWQCQYKYKNQHQKLPPLKFWVLENPFYASTKWFLGKPTFIFQPYEFGNRYKKKTALWGYFNEPKKLKKWTMPNNKKFDRLLMAEIKKLKSPLNCDAGSPQTRQILRAITPSGFARAFYEANQ